MRAWAVADLSMARTSEGAAAWGRRATALMVVKATDWPANATGGDDGAAVGIAMLGSSPKAAASRPAAVRKVGRRAPA